MALFRQFNKVYRDILALIKTEIIKSVVCYDRRVYLIKTEMTQNHRFLSLLKYVYKACF